MHEVTLCQNALDIIEQQAKQSGAQRVTAVWLELSAVSCIEEDALHFCFDIVCRDSLAEGAELHVTTVLAQAWCRSVRNRSVWPGLTPDVRTAAAITCRWTAVMPCRSDKSKFSSPVRTYQSIRSRLCV